MSGGPNGGPREDDPDVTASDGTALCGPSGTATRWLRGIRRVPARRRVAVVVATLVGLVLAWVHWVGLVLAGALVGLVSETPRRAVVAGLVVGALVLGLHVWASPAMDAGEFLALAPPSYVTVVAGLVLPVWGALVRYAL